MRTQILIRPVATKRSRLHVALLGLATLSVLAIWSSSLWADYLVFRINVGEVPQSGGVAGGQPGVPGQPGFPGGPPGGFAGGAPGGFAGGAPGRFPGGFPGGAPGDFPGGAPGFPPGGGVGEGIPGQPGDQSQQSEVAAEWFLAVLPGEMRAVSPRGPYSFHYDGGQFSFQPGIGVAHLAEIHLIPAPSVQRELDELIKKKGLATKAPAELALWMLQHWTYSTGRSGFDMLKRFEEQLLAWEKMGLAKLPEADRPVIQALIETRRQLKEAVPEATDVLNRISQLVQGCVLTSKEGYHYSIIHTQQDQKQADDLVERLERVFHGVYYWFAYRGYRLPLPSTRLVVWLTDNAAACQQLRLKLQEVRPLLADGFYSRLDKVLVIAPHRLDAAYGRFQARIQDVDALLLEMGNKVWSQLSGGQPPPPEYTLSLQKLVKPDAATKKFLTLIQQAAQQDPQIMATLSLANILVNSASAIHEEGIVATVSREGARQILDAVGLLPARAGFPETWRDGLLGLVETPKSNGDFRAPAFHSGIGNVHWVYLPVFSFFTNEDRLKKGEVVFYEKTSRQVTIPVKRFSLTEVIRGNHYKEAQQAKPEQHDLLLLKARAESWALVHFLAETRWRQLMQFYEELARLPRDLEIRPEVVEGIFAMVFGLADAKQPNTLDPQKLQRLEEEWRKFMSRQSLPLRLPAYVDANPNPPANKPGQPNAPGLPPGGGFPMP